MTLPAPVLETVTTYGYTKSVVAEVVRPTTVDEARAALSLARGRGLSVATAGGRNSFGDVFQLDGQLVVDLSGLDTIHRFDPKTGVLVVGAGVRIPAILAQVMPAGWFLCGLSGSLWNTVGGNLGSNIQGKDSWRYGNFVENVQSFQLLRADGEQIEVDRESEPELFAAVPGGLGLLGMVTELTLQLRRIPSTRVVRSSQRTTSLDETIAALADLNGSSSDFAYAWTDALASEGVLGRGVFETGRFEGAHFEGVDDPASREEFLAGLHPRQRVAGMPTETFWSVYRMGWNVLVALRSEKHFHRLMNELKYRSASRSVEVESVSFPEYQYPMVKRFGHWRDRFRPAGFHELHSLFPTAAAGAAFRELLTVCKNFGVVPEICGIRRHRDDPTLLSFRGDGLSMTVSHPLAHFPEGRLADFTEAFLSTVEAHGGRIYLAKFPFLSPERFRRMFPEYERFQAIKGRVDPDRLFWSDAAERLGL